MPYIKTEDRIRLVDLESAIKQITTEIKSPGELNYLVTLLAIRYFSEHKNYQGINDVVGALEGAKLEFYRRVAAGYEDEKIALNGDVY